MLPRSLDTTLFVFIVTIQKNPIAERYREARISFLFTWWCFVRVFSDSSHQRLKCLFRYLHNVNLGFVNENHIILKFEMTILPTSPELPLLSSTESIISRILSPPRSFLWLHQTITTFMFWFMICNYFLHVGNIKLDFSIFPDTIWHDEAGFLSCDDVKHSIFFPCLLLSRSLPWVTEMLSQ